jgi:molybdopterin-guanine dinucleotide biosynthesis protein A
VSAPVAGILLTGGKSRRLGVDKARLVLDGETLAVRGARLLTGVCAPVMEVGAGASGLRAVLEEPAGAGPLAAIAAGGEELRARGHRGAVVVLAVDLPCATPALLAALRDWPGEPTVVPRAAGRLQLVSARYGADALVAARSLVTAGVRALGGLLDVVDHDVMEESVWGAVASADAFADVDTPADAARLHIDLPG